MPINRLIVNLSIYLRNYYQNDLETRFKIVIDDGESNYDVLNKIALKRGLLNKGNGDINKAIILLLKEFKDGLIGKISLERI